MTPSSLSRASTQPTERNLGDLIGKVRQVYLEKDAGSGLGRDLPRLLYSKNAKVSITGRFKERTNEAIKSIEAAVSESSGYLVFPPLDLDDLIKASASCFFAAEQQIHVLFGNTGF
ncbi:hypothetical protein DL771_005094 [Monosporascus sp. 5C6A]|nr:hypothetical protein DL771_005094 [Monosporascus sp. 5C6A]